MNIHVSSLALYVFVVLILFCSTPTEGVIRSSTSSSTQSVLSVGVNTNATADTARSKSRATHAHTNRVEGGGIGDRLKRSARGRVPSFVDPKKQIYDAVADDSPASLERLMNKYASTSDVLQISSKRGKVNIYTAMEYRDSRGRTPLLLAIEHSSKTYPYGVDYAGGEKLKLYDQDKALRCLYILLVSGKANIDARDADGNSALQLAVKHGHNSIYLKLILDRLGPIDHLNNQGEDALFIAIDSQQWTTYCQLMVKDYQQSSVLPSIATLKERLSAKAMEALVKAIPSAGNTLRTGPERAFFNEYRSRPGVSVEGRMFISLYITVLSRSEITSSVDEKRDRQAEARRRAEAAQRNEEEFRQRQRKKEEAEKEANRMASEKERRQRNPDWHKETGTHVNEDGEEESYEFWTKDDSEMDDDDSYTFFHKNDGDDDGDGEFHTPKEDPSEFYTPKEGPSDRGNMGGGSTKSGNDQSFESQAACIARVRRDFHKATLSGENAVKKYYRKTLMPLHPDRTSQLPEAERLAREECFKELGNLYSTYMDSRGKK